MKRLFTGIYIGSWESWEKGSSGGNFCRYTRNFYIVFGHIQLHKYYTT